MGSLTGLTVLSLTWNHIASTSPRGGGLSAASVHPPFASLTSLDLSFNGLQDFSVALAQALPACTHLILSDNALTALPSHLPLRLISLDLNYNKITTLLTSINMGDSSSGASPAAQTNTNPLLKCTKLVKFSVAGNPLVSPPISVVLDGGFAGIKQWLIAHGGGSAPASASAALSSPSHHHHQQQSVSISRFISPQSANAAAALVTPPPQLSPPHSNSSPTAYGGYGGGAVTAAGRPSAPPVSSVLRRMGSAGEHKMRSPLSSLLGTSTDSPPEPLRSPPSLLSSQIDVKTPAPVQTLSQRAVTTTASAVSAVSNASGSLPPTTTASAGSGIIPIAQIREERALWRLRQNQMAGAAGGAAAGNAGRASSPLPPPPLAAASLEGQPSAAPNDIGSRSEYPEFDPSAPPQRSASLYDRKSFARYSLPVSTAARSEAPPGFWRPPAFNQREGQSDDSDNESADRGGGGGGGGPYYRYPQSSLSQSYGDGEEGDPQLAHAMAASLRDIHRSYSQSQSRSNSIRTASDRKSYPSIAALGMNSDRKRMARLTAATRSNGGGGVSGRPFAFHHANSSVGGDVWDDSDREDGDEEMYGSAFPVVSSQPTTRDLALARSLISKHKPQALAAFDRALNESGSAGAAVVTAAAAKRQTTRKPRVPSQRTSNARIGGPPRTAGGSGVAAVQSVTARLMADSDALLRELGASGIASGSYYAAAAQSQYRPPSANASLSALPVMLSPPPSSVAAGWSPPPLFGSSPNQVVSDQKSILAAHHKTPSPPVRRPSGAGAGMAAAVQAVPIQPRNPPPPPQPAPPPPVPPPPPPAAAAAKPKPKPVDAVVALKLPEDVEIPNHFLCPITYELMT